MENPTKMDVVWMEEAGKVIRSQLFLYHPANQQEARMDWYKIPDGSYEFYAGEGPAGPRYTLFLVDQIKNVEECCQKSSQPSKHLLKLNYFNSSREPLQIYFQQKEDLKSWVEALKRALDIGKKQRKKLEKQHKNKIRNAKSDTEENTYAPSSVADTVAFEVDVDSTAASVRNEMVGDGTIIISKCHITLACKSRDYTITWHFKHVRRFGYSSTSFILEGGHRSGPKGEGLFMFSNCPGPSIRECIKDKMSVIEEGSSERSSSMENIANSDQIYSEIKKIHKKLDADQPAVKGKSTQSLEFYAGLPAGRECDATESTSSVEGGRSGGPRPPKPPHKSILDVEPISSRCGESNPKMSDVLQSLSQRAEYCNGDVNNPEAYSSLSFCPEQKSDPTSDLSLVTGNLYGDALCHQNGLQGDKLYSNCEAEYSQVDYNKARPKLAKKAKNKKS